MSKLKAKDPLAPERGPLASPRFIVALVLMALGIAWIAYYYIASPRPDAPSRRPEARQPEVHGATSATGTT